jgi:hypothetical protein
MSSLDELRRTFAQHADGLHDPERHTRPATVRARVRAARRRRAGALAVAAVVALVLVTGTTALVRRSPDPQPAGPKLEDVPVPQRIEVLGTPYRLIDTRRAAPDGSIEAPAGGDDRFVTLVATGLGSGRATLWSGYGSVARVRGDQQLSAPAPAPAADDLRVELDGALPSARTEVAIYEPTGEPAPGVADDGVVFVERYDDRELVGAQFADAGAEARVAVPDDASDLTVSAYCHSETGDLWLHRSGTSGSFPCADLAAVETEMLLHPQPGERTLGAYVTQGRNGPRATGIDVTFGIALYRRAVAPTTVLGEEVRTLVDYDGRTWRLDDVLDSGPSEYDVDTSDGDVYIGVVYVGATEMSVTWPGAPEGGFGGFRETDERQGPGTMYPGILFAGDHTVELNLGGPDADSRLLVYRPL